MNKLGLRSPAIQNSCQTESVTFIVAASAQITSYGKRLLSGSL